MINTDLTDCKTVLQRIDPDPTGCKMDAGLIGSMAMCNQWLLSFVIPTQPQFISQYH